MNQVKYIYKKSIEPTFIQKGLKGYQFDISDPALEIYEVDVSQGHDNFIISKKVTHTYYVLEGSGSFIIDGEKMEVLEKNLIQIPPNIEYTYSGKMKLLLIVSPPWFKGNEIITKPNPDVE